MGIRRIGLLGYGTVGQAVHELIQRNLWERAEVVMAGVRNTQRPSALQAPTLTTNLLEVVEAPEVEVVIEVMGGVEPALTLIKRALSLGKPVITANKELVAKHYDELKAFGGELRFEAAVGGGIPIIQVLSTLAQTNRIESIEGIVNGTTNFMLTEMEARQASFDTILAEAQSLGFAEADPTADVDGFDAMYKIAILGSIATGEQVSLDDIQREGIRAVTPESLVAEREQGRRIKLIARWTSDGAISVAPTALPLDHPLASVDGSFNAVRVVGDFVGPLTLIGRGAGGHPTASAVCGDLVQILEAQRRAGEAD